MVVKMVPRRWNSWLVSTMPWRGPAVLALSQRQVIGPHPADAELRFLPGCVHQAELPDGPLLPAGHRLGVLRINLEILRRRLAVGGLVGAHLGRDTMWREVAGLG